MPQDEGNEIQAYAIDDYKLPERLKIIRASQKRARQN
jgi:hypothetical protein